MAQMGSDVRSRARENATASSWESFCREEARQWASAFLERVRGFKLRNVLAREVHDSTFTNEFSAAFLEESSLLMASSDGTEAQGNGQLAHLTTSLPATHNQATRPPTAPEVHVSSPTRKTNNSKAKSWFSNLFKWSKGQRTRRTSTPNLSSRQGRSRRNTDVVKEEQVRMLNMNADDSSSQFAWQPCRLALLKENTNHQLDVYSPPKSSVPKMSLFCFLIKEVRAATSLEIPDSTTCFVIKSQNHGEYVFDAGTDDKKHSWISTIRAHSVNLSTNSNGHLPGYSNGGSTRPRSYSIGAGDLRTPPSTLQRGIPTTPTSLTPSQRRGSGPSAEGASRLIPPARGSTHSEESVLMDVSAFVRNSPHRSPSRRRRVQSMFVESNHLAQIEHTPPTLSQGAGFPYDSPLPSPPPLPKRGLRPKNIAVGSSSRLDQEPKIKSPTPPLISASNERGTPQRRLSQPHVGLRTQSELPSNLDTCSVSSSSSALHPVTLADIERRGPLSPSHIRYSSQLSILSEGQATALPKPANHRVRKISAPVLVPNQPYLDHQDIIHPEDINRNHSSENVPLSPLSNHDNDQSDRRTPNNEEGDRNEDMTSKATLNFPRSPNSQWSRLSSEEDQGPDTRRRLVPYTRLNVSSLASQAAQTSSREETERSHSQASNNTEGSTEDREPSQPLYIETTNAEDYQSQASIHTQHPYENWATTPQDVENLRQMSQYPWFHGMISRNNASQIVLSEGDNGTGQYLVRQSESREGDFVLTFNYHNRAKHLRLTVDESGCNIQHLWFDDVPGMLEYFKTNSIPLESFWLNNDVKLTTYINRRKSDNFRTTTVVNMTQLSREPPRRSRSLHIHMSQGVASNVDTPSPIDRSISSSNSSNTNSTNSLPHSARNGTGWRQLFRSQRSSSAGNMSVHGVRSGVSVQRRHSTNAGSVLDTRGRGSGRSSGMNSQNNNYVSRNY